MPTDRYGSARWANSKDLSTESIIKIPAEKLTDSELKAEKRTFLLGCDTEPAKQTNAYKTICERAADMGITVIDGADGMSEYDLIRKIISA